jgi:MinD-like ATPase involved in chromosome partitioning or flagellar assembly
MSPVLFDDSLPRLADAVRRTLGHEALEHGIVLRDSTGRLSFVVPHNERPSEDQRIAIEQELNAALGSYARPDDLLIYSDDPGAHQLLQDPMRLSIKVGDAFCQVIDRRIVGAGWLERPGEEANGPPRLVFASLKGGVGRSTALAVAAADLARRGKNVLVIDLDLEAPGLGDILLDEERTPRFGVLDFLVENGIGGVPDALLDGFIGTSILTTGSGGRVDVVPAIGRRSAANPANILPKLSRSMIEDITDSGETISVGAQISTMTRRLATSASYDVVLIDSRAGLSELAAPAVLGLGANVLLFGTAQRQTIEGYRALFAALKLLAQRERSSGGDAGWRLMFKAVYAKASLDTTVAARYHDDLYELFAEHLYDAEEQDIENAKDHDEVYFAIDDPSAPHSPLIVPFSQSFVDFDPVHAASHLTQPFYEQTFRPFLDGLDIIISSTGLSP